MTVYWEQLTDIFNNREIAIGSWILILFAIVVVHRNFRQGLLDVLKALLQPKLLAFYGTVAATVVSLCYVLARFNLWTIDQLPASILWFVLSGSVLAGRAMQAQEDEGHFKGLIRNSIKLTGLFEFIVVAHSFSIVTEFILVPVLVALGLVIAVADKEPKHAKIKTIFEWIVVGTVIALVWNSVSQIWSDPNKFLTTTTGLNFLLPVFLTVGCIPVFYSLYCYSHIEGARIQIDQKTFQSEDLKRYARKRFILIFMARP